MVAAAISCASACSDSRIDPGNVEKKSSCSDCILKFRIDHGETDLESYNREFDRSWLNKHGNSTLAGVVYAESDNDPYFMQLKSRCDDKRLLLSLLLDEQQEDGKIKGYTIFSERVEPSVKTIWLTGPYWID